MPHTTPKETVDQRRLRTADWFSLSRLASTLPRREKPGRAASRRAAAPARKLQRRRLKREERLFRTVPVEGRADAAARRARVRASRS